MLFHCNNGIEQFESFILKSFLILKQCVFIWDLESNPAFFPLPCASFSHSVLFWYCQSANVCISLFINITAKAGAMGEQFYTKCYCHVTSMPLWDIQRNIPLPDSFSRDGWHQQHYHKTDMCCWKLTQLE